MKDEEMAEEYKRQFYGVTSLFSFSDIEQAFLAGLKAGRPHWHDLRKEPNDLPKNKRNVWCDYNDGYGKGYYDKILKQTSAYKIGVCFDFQWIEQVPVEEHDIRMDLVIKSE